MQELLAKIIEMDAQARKIKAQAEQEKIAGEEEIEKLRQQIYDDYIARAKSRVEKNIAVDRREAEEKYSASQKETGRLLAEMEMNYKENGDFWVNEIVKRSLE